MPVEGKWIEYGDQRAYFAWPEHAAKPLPSLLVIQEIWGVEDQIIDVTQRIAAAGYAALAPDLFANQGVRPQHLSAERLLQAHQISGHGPSGFFRDPVARAQVLSSLPEQQRAEVEETLTSIYSAAGNQAANSVAVHKAFDYLRHEREETKGQNVACVGFCMGGGLSALLAVEEPELAGAAIYYGSSPAPADVAKIKCPVLGFYGELDQRVNAGIPGFDAAAKESGVSFEYHIYKNANHGFFNETGRVYDVNAARDSFVRLLSFFQKTLVT